MKTTPAPKKKTGKPPAKATAPTRPAKRPRPLEDISDEDLMLRAAMRGTGTLDLDTDPALEEDDAE
jgi:hypothetical protein